MNNSDREPLGSRASNFEMDNSDPPKARRPLPTPGATPAPRPLTPVQRPAQRAIEASTFYGTGTSSSAKAAPPLPSRTKNGSNLTTYHTVPDPPRYDYNPPGYREPELVVDDVMDDEIPELISQDPNNGWGSTEGPGGWESASEWNSNWVEPMSTSNGFDAMDFLTPSKQDSDLPIDGRVDREELNWWNPEERAKWKRPGPGMLAPMLADELHEPNHSLYSVNITNLPSAPSTNPPLTARPDQSSSFTATPPQPPHSAVPLSSTPSFDSSQGGLYPSEEEIRTAIPHPNAYYCPKENGWVILSWKSSIISPPLASSFSSQLQLPDQSQRRRTTNCLSEEERSFGCGNKTHHFHRYPKAVDSLKITPPYAEDRWVSEELKKMKRRGRTVVNDMERLRSDPGEDSGNESAGEQEGLLLDLYMCCQCGLYCTVSPLIPGVIPRKYLDDFVRDKRSHPSVGKSGELTALTGVETFLVAIENKLFKGNNRLIKIHSSGFQMKLGWNSTIKKIFESIGFGENTANNDATLMSPNTDPADSAGPVNKKKLLRAWVEVSAWIVDFKRTHATALRDYQGIQKVCVSIENAREMYQTAIGAHPDQIPRGDVHDPTLSAVYNLHDEWRGLGMTVTTFSPELLTFAYLAQCRCDPAGTPRYFTYLSSIVSGLVNSTGSCPPQLQELLVMEQSRHRFTFADVQTAAQTLGFGADGDIHLEYDEEDIEDTFVQNAWKDLIKRSWRDPENCAEIHRKANDALRVLAESRGSVYLMKVLESEKNKMNPDQAYNTLEVPKETDDFMLITVFNMRLEETTAQMDKMKEALAVIAETRDSERLRQFLATGQDPGEITIPTRHDLPRGLNQLGNTCYLNSLLQYFYTIRELRDAVTPMANLDLKLIEENKLSDDDISKHRVGGRHVTRREIVRSKKFISQLARLFADLEYSETPAVTPEIELAKLALVTSRDEEEDEADKAPAAEPPTPSLSNGSVLGKRGRELDLSRQKSVVDMDVEGYVLVSSPPRRTGSPQSMEQDRASPMKGITDKDGDASMKEATPAPDRPPPPPPRKVDSIDSGGMMFGKQHDVAECMDNCMFQIETALLKFDSVDESQLERTSVVKKLFYGKMRQRLTGVVPNSRASIHEKEDLFSHLPVNVVNDGVDIYDGLSGYFDDVVDWEGGKARMEVTLVDAPPLLQIQLQRVQFNRETLQPYKSQAYVKFGEIIYLDRFMDNVDVRKKHQSRLLQRQLNDCRERIRILLEGKNGSFMSTLEHTSIFLSTIRDKNIPGVEDNLINTLRDEQASLHREIDELREVADRLKDELEDLWKDSKNYPYELTSVFIHRGSSPSFGHYFFYSRNLPDEPDSWFKYNDSDVTVVPKDEVLQDTTGSTANPYLLVFARKGSNVVKTVNRFDVAALEDAL